MRTLSMFQPDEGVMTCVTQMLVHHGRLRWDRNDICKSIEEAHTWPMDLNVGGLPPWFNETKREALGFMQKKSSAFGSVLADN